MEHHVMRSVKWIWAAFVILHFVAPQYLSAEERMRAQVVMGAEQMGDDVAQAFGYEHPVPPPRKREWWEIADEQAELQQVNKCLVRALIKVESVNGTKLVSPAGALGHTQLMPDTARRACDIRTDADRLDPEQNIYCGVKVLKLNIVQYGLFRGLQVYNAGPKRVGMTKENVEYPHKILKVWAECVEV